MVEIIQASFISMIEKVKLGVAFDMELEMKKIAPVDTGNLRNQIDFFIKDDAVIFEFVPYTIHVEFGTIYQDAQPFIRNTFHRKLIEIVKKNISKHSFEVRV